MIIYDFACTAGHRFEAGVASMSSPPPECACGAATNRRPSRVRLGGIADAGVPRDQLPNTWRGTRGGDRETVDHWRAVAQHRASLEERHPELAGDRRPVLAHEGIFADRPLRAGDDIAASVGEALAAKTSTSAEHVRSTPAARASSARPETRA